ncbi:unnamed protein product [Tilletia caries]|uniref:Uncharacterized protein n=1 Tax=Tilletia caries TaxID=13290 RepID=A0ABN7JBJ3_9BASI|nr:unnamed protein product [Tilletia caries]CAD6957850.1 unnamed protein product [Tilletia caries]
MSLSPPTPPPPPSRSTPATAPHAQVTPSAVKSWPKSAWELPTSRLASIGPPQRRPGRLSALPPGRGSPTNTSSTPASRTKVGPIVKPNLLRSVLGSSPLTNCVRLEVIKQFELDRL